MINLYGNDILDPNNPDDYELIVAMKKLGVKFRVLDAVYVDTSIRDKVTAGKFAWREHTNEEIEHFLRYRVDDGNGHIAIWR